jgi:proteasome lid subunit RPN8/RPN11
MYYFEARYHAPPSFISRDVLFEEKPWMSPYVYCSNSPLTRIDPSGMLDGDYYDEKGVYLGSDGIDDGKIYVVPNSEEAKQISAADDKCMTTPVNSVNSAVELPSLSIRQEMSTVIDMDAKDPYREYGGSIFGDANGETFVAWANPGERFTPNDEYANIDLNNYQNPTQIYKATTLISTFHSHPSGEIDGYGVSQVPSAADINNAKQRTSFIGNHYLFGAKSGKVSIYDKNGVKATFPVELFRALGK